MRLVISFLGLSWMLSTAVIAHASTASLSERVLSDDGRALRATVTLNLAAARGYPTPPRRVRTDANGNFAFSRVSAGTYKLCAQDPPANGSYHYRDAVTIKRYNGASAPPGSANSNYVSFSASGPNPGWSIDNLNNGAPKLRIAPFDYVSQVCSQTPYSY
jgi:hypothetical protein